MTILNGQPIGDPAPKPTVAPATPAAASASRPMESSTFILSIMALIFAFSIPLVGAIMGGIGVAQARRAGQPNSIAKVALILGILFTVLIVAAVVVMVVFGIGLFSELFRVCQEFGEGVHDYNGVTYTCS